MRSIPAATFLVGALLFVVNVVPQVTLADEALTPQAFATAAIGANSFELQSAKLAQQRSLSKDTKDFATHMIRDHTHAGDMLAKAASNQGINVPAELDPENQRKLNALKIVAAGDFDQAYLSTQVTAHEDVLKLFQTYSKSGPDGPLRNAANAIMPTLKMHNVRVHLLASPG
jgi:putative membrane protein